MLRLKEENAQEVSGEAREKNSVGDKEYLHGGASSLDTTWKTCPNSVIAIVCVTLPENAVGKERELL